MAATELPNNGPEEGGKASYVWVSLQLDQSPSAAHQLGTGAQQKLASATASQGAPFMYTVARER